MSEIFYGGYQLTEKHRVTVKLFIGNCLKPSVNGNAYDVPDLRGVAFFDDYIISVENAETFDSVAGDPVREKLIRAEPVGNGKINITAEIPIGVERR